MPRTPRHHGLTLLEAALSVALIAALLSILVPALSSARSHSFRDHCHENQRRIGQAWQMYLADHNHTFPSVPTQSGWFYGGVRFSALNDQAFPDSRRPLTPYLPVFRTNDTHEILWCCPADRGIGDPNNISRGTAGRTAFQSYGTSYRANSALFQLPSLSGDQHDPNATTTTTNDDEEPRGMQRSEITTAASRLVLGGDAVWNEVAESTGLTANWHGVPNAGNLLFLDGSVRFVTVKPKNIIGPVVFDPRMRGSAKMEPDSAAEPVDEPEPESVTKP